MKMTKSSSINNNYKGLLGEKLQMDRKTIEKNRRNHMKSLCLKLFSLVPSQHFYPFPKEELTQQDQLEQVATYIKNLQGRVEVLINDRKELLAKRGSRLLFKPIVEITEIDSSLQVVLVCGSKNSFMLYEAISIIEEAGGQVISARFSVNGDKIFHTLHAKAKVSRVGVETSMVYERLQQLITS